MPGDQYARLYAPGRRRRPSTRSTCRATAWATTWPLSRTSRRRPPRRSHLAGPVACGQAPHGLLPHQPVQAPGKQRRGVPAVDRAAHPPQLRLPARDRERSCRCRSARRMLACSTPAATTRTSMTKTPLRTSFEDERRGVRHRLQGVALCGPKADFKNEPPRSTKRTPRNSSGGSSGCGPTCSCHRWRKT